MWGNPTLFQQRKSILKILGRDKYWQNQLTEAVIRGA